MSDTPRTHKIEKFFFGDNRPGMEIECVKATFAEALERENTALRAHAERLAEALGYCRGIAVDSRLELDADHNCSGAFDNIVELAETALTLYRAENPRV